MTKKGGINVGASIYRTGNKRKGRYISRTEIIEIRRRHALKARPLHRKIFDFVLKVLKVFQKPGKNSRSSSR